MVGRFHGLSVPPRNRQVAWRFAYRFGAASGRLCAVLKGRLARLVLQYRQRPLRPSTVHSFPSLAGLLLLAVTLTSARTPCFPLPGPVCFVWGCCYYSAFSLARPQSWRGFFTSAQLKAAAYSHMAPITS